MHTHTERRTKTYGWHELTSSERLIGPPKVVIGFLTLILTPTLVLTLTVTLTLSCNLVQKNHGRLRHDLEPDVDLPDFGLGLYRVKGKGLRVI